MNKSAKFYGDIPRGYKLQFNLASEIELLETAGFAYNFV